MISQNSDSALFKNANDAYTNNILERHSIYRSFITFVFGCKNVGCNVTSIPKAKKTYLSGSNTKNSFLNIELTSPGLTVIRYHATYLTIYQRPPSHRPLCIALDHHGKIWNQKTVYVHL